MITLLIILLLCGIYLDFYSFYKQRIELKSIIEDEKRSEKLEKLIGYFINLIKEKNNDTRECVNNFDQLLCEICILIDNNLINKSCLKYKYLPLIKQLIEKKLINKIAITGYGEFKEEWYQYLYDIYNTRCRRIDKRIFYKIKVRLRIIFYGM